MKWGDFYPNLCCLHAGGYFSHHFSNEEVEQLVGQGVVPTSKVSHGVQTGLGGNAGGPIDFPAHTFAHRQQTQLRFQFKTIIK